MRKQVLFRNKVRLPELSINDRAQNSIGREAANIWSPPRAMPTIPGGPIDEPGRLGADEQAQGEDEEALE
eukprot:2729075-Alexandrium_andersonii.AAC.2